MKFVEAHHGNKKKVSIYGQEYTNTTYKLCKMNLAIRGISANPVSYTHARAAFMVFLARTGQANPQP